MSIDLADYFSNAYHDNDMRRHEELYKDFCRLLTAGPQCPIHGRCTRFLLLWLEAKQAKSDSIPTPKDCSAWDEQTLERFPVFPPFSTNRS